MSVCIINAKAFCAEDITNIENYEKALNSEEKYVCHHRLETHTSDGERRKVDISREELIALCMYYHRPAEELIFMVTGEHTKLHSEHRKGKNSSFYGKHHSEETKRKIAEASKGNTWNKGKPKSEEHKQKIAEANKGKRHSDDSYKRQSEKMKGRHLSEETKKKLSEANKGENNAFYGKHHSEETKKKLYEANKGSNSALYGKHWKLVDGKRVYY